MLIPFLVNKGKFWLKNLIHKIQRNLTQPVKFVVIYDTKNMSLYFFLENRPSSHVVAHSNIVYEFTWRQICQNLDDTQAETVRNIQEAFDNNVKGVTQIKM